MPLPPEISDLIKQLHNELDCIEERANTGLVLVSQLLERFPNNSRLISLSANVGNGLFFVASFRRRIKIIIQKVSGANVPSKDLDDAGEELSEVWGRVLECKIVVNRSVNTLEELQ